MFESTPPVHIHTYSTAAAVMHVVIFAFIALPGTTKFSTAQPNLDILTSLRHNLWCISVSKYVRTELSSLQHEDSARTLDVRQVVGW